MESTKEKMLKAIREEYTLGNIPTPDASILSEMIDEADLGQETPSTRRTRLWRKFVSVRRHTMIAKEEEA